MNLKIIFLLLFFAKFCSSQFNSRVKFEACGEVKIGSSYIIGGNFSAKGQWPWLSSLFLSRNNDYICGSSIISKKHLLSVAHCFDEKNSEKRRGPEDVYALLGRYNLDDENEKDFVKAQFSEIFIHSEWDSSVLSHDADIVVIKLKKEVVFSHFIQPICLPSATQNAIGVQGTVAGYGYTEINGKVITIRSNKPKHVELKVIDDRVCLYKATNLASVGSIRMFCAGEIGKNPCSGDSGSGFSIRTNRKWTIIGIVSAGETQYCHENQYVLYTDVSKYIQWINGILDLEIFTPRPTPAQQPRQPQPELIYLNKQHFLRPTVQFSTQYPTPSNLNRKKTKAPQILQGSQETKCGPYFKNSPKCGVRKIEKGNGDSYRGQWPWDVTLRRKSKGTLKFLCIAILINEWTLITSGECVAVKNEAIYAYIGQFDFKNENEEKWNLRGISEIIVHEDYKKGSKDANIAILIMDKKVDFNDFIQPICLPSADDFENIVNVEGFMSRYINLFYKENSIFNIPENFKFTVIDPSICSGYNRQNEKSVCVKYSIECSDRRYFYVQDTGAGFFLKNGGKWTTIGLSYYNSMRTCGSPIFSLTKLTVFVDWIVKNMKLC